MTYNIHTWKIKAGEDILGQVLSFVDAIEAIKVIRRDLSGGVHVQTIGTGAKTASVSILSTNEERKQLNEVESTAQFVSVFYRDKLYVGYIASQIDWETIIPGEWYKANIKVLMVEEE